MSQVEDEDDGEFNESMVMLQPVRFTQRVPSTLISYNNLPQNNLGIYEDIKLTSLYSGKAGKLIEFVTISPNSINTFVTHDAVQLLEQYTTEEIAFVLVMGNKDSGKSFFCDKILNLAEIRGNHFCRNKNVGIHLWSAPFQKDNLNIFMMEISGCSIGSEQFKLLSTYALLIGSSFVLLDGVDKTKAGVLEQADAVFHQIVDQITPSKMENGEQIKSNRNVFMPSVIYNLKRDSNRKEEEYLVLGSHIDELLPDALVKSYSGSPQDLIHLSFLDKKCISEQYIRKTAYIFKQIYNKLSEKKYNELTLNGNIILKVSRYIQNYLNNQQMINIEHLYEEIIEDLYLSAYNYCILTYHEDMQAQFEDQKPKSLDQLLLIFERVSENILQKFNDFTLDQNLHKIYEEKLEKHITEKELMIMDINKDKTALEINQVARSTGINNFQNYQQFLNKVDNDKKELTHGRADVVGKVANDLFLQLKTNNNVDYLIMKQIEKLKAKLAEKQKTYEQVRKIGQEKSKQRSIVDKEKEIYRKKDKTLDDQIRDLKSSMNNMRNSMVGHSGNVKEQLASLQAQSSKNQQIISQLKQNDGKKPHNDVTSRENKLEQLRKRIEIQQKLLKELNESTPTNTEGAKLPEKKVNGKEKQAKEAPKAKQ